jgi:uncharacterized protein YcfJ
MDLIVKLGVVIGTSLVGGAIGTAVGWKTGDDVTKTSKDNPARFMVIVVGSAFGSLIGAFVGMSAGVVGVFAYSALSRLA